jgi:3-phosphoshikimate 1-carboxyvinyltransferase
MLKGNIFLPGDKSISHRIALFSVLGRGSMEIENFSPGEDCGSSLKAIEALGAKVSKNDDKVLITGLSKDVIKSDEPIVIDCGNSGTTIRLLMGILCGLDGQFVLTGDKYLCKRPMERIAGPLRLFGADIKTQENGVAPIHINGSKLSAAEYTLPIASAQLKSAFLLAGISSNGKSSLEEPVLCRDHTEKMLENFGAKFSKTGTNMTVENSILNLPSEFYVPGDPSSAAFFLIAAAVIPGSCVTAKNVLLNPTRIGFLDVLQKMNADVTIVETGNVPEPMGDITVKYSSNLTSVEIFPEDIPGMVDEIPILSLIAALAKGTSVFHGVQELRVKETDRLEAIKSELEKMGAVIELSKDEVGDSLIVTGVNALQMPKDLNSFGDHRMAMTLRLAMLLVDGECEIAEENCVKISFPQFHEILQQLKN